MFVPIFVSVCALVSHLADTLVVKLAQLWEYISLVVPVMSSHWAGAVPPAEGLQLFIKNLIFFQATPSGINLQSLSLSLCPSPGRTPVCFSLFQAVWQDSYVKSGRGWKRLAFIFLSENERIIFDIDHKLFVPITLQRRRRLVVSPSPASRGLSLQDGGKGMRSPIGRWNLRRRGSTVTTGLNVAWFPNCRVSSSSGIGWACAKRWK